MNKKVTAHIVTADDPDTGRRMRQLIVNGYPLMGVAEVADALGVRVQNVDAVRGLPDPVDEFKATRMWLGSEIVPLAKKREQKAAEAAVKAA